jgi:Fe-S-cluster containining protein
LTVYHRLTTLRFECTGCGACCHGDSESYIGVSAAESERIRDYLGLSPAWFRRRYLVRVAGIGRSIRLEADGRCTFLDADGRCRVYPVRPVQCSTYPFWPEVVATRGAWRSEARRCEGIGRGPGVAQQTVEVELERARVAESAIKTEQRRR